MTEKRLQTILIPFSEKNEYKIKKKALEAIDTGRADHRVFYSRVNIMKVEDEIVILTEQGKKLRKNLKITKLDTKDQKDKFEDMFHIILSRNLWYYVKLVELSQIETHFRNADTLFEDYKEYIGKDGFTIPQPSFNSLVLLAKLTGLLQKSSSTISLLPKNLIEYRTNMILKILQVDYEGFERISTLEFLETFISRSKSNHDSLIDIEQAWEILKDVSDEIGIKFKMGVGGGPVQGLYGNMEISEVK